MTKQDRVTIQDVIDYLDERVFIDGEELKGILHQIEEVPEPVEITQEQADYIEGHGGLFGDNDLQYIIWKSYKEWFEMEAFDGRKASMPFNLEHRGDGDLFRKAVNYGYVVVEEDVEDLYIIEAGDSVIWSTPRGLKVRSPYEFIETDVWKYIFTAEELEDMGFDVGEATKVDVEGNPVE